MNSIEHLKVKIFSDGANLDEMVQMAGQSHIKGLTTNPTLMKKEGIADYETFCRAAISKISKPISFEVFTDDLDEMFAQAMQIASWGENVYVKIPVTNTKGESCANLVKALAEQGVKTNVTALMTIKQVTEISNCLNSEVPSYVSVFAGRIADTGVDPIPLMTEALAILRSNAAAELIWASPRELLNVFQADEIGCDVITVTNDILGKLDKVGYNLESYSLDTVKMFYNDAQQAGYKIET